MCVPLVISLKGVENKYERLYTQNIRVNLNFLKFAIVEMENLFGHGNVI